MWELSTSTTKEGGPVQTVFRQARAAASDRRPLVAVVATGLLLGIVLAAATGVLWAVVTGAAAAIAMVALLIAAGNARPAPVPVRVRRR